jgi:hypothetical protein
MAELLISIEGIERLPALFTTKLFTVKNPELELLASGFGILSTKWAVDHLNSDIVKGSIYLIFTMPATQGLMRLSACQRIHNRKIHAPSLNTEWRITSARVEIIGVQHRR